jgi:hypothetical protein
MSLDAAVAKHNGEHARSTSLNPMMTSRGDTIRAGSRRWFLQTGTAGLAGLSLVDLFRLRTAAATSGISGGSTNSKKSVLLFWLSGGPSHIDMWDPKPTAPQEIRGPYQSINTGVPGIAVCEHLPLTAQIMPKLSIIRSVDCSASNHTPVTMQSGNALARRTDDGNDGQGYPSMGSVVARLRGPNAANLPAFVGLADTWKSDVWGAGHLGNRYEPVNGKELPGRLAMPKGIEVPRVRDRDALRQEFDRFRRDLDLTRGMEGADRFSQMAVDMVTSEHVRRAFDVSQETAMTRDAYGAGSLGEKALLARRLVEAGVTFVLVSGAWGYFDHHGDEVHWGGIQKGLTPILPSLDRALFALMKDLEARGLLDSTLVLVMGEFGRTPVMTPTAGRGHWTNCMSMIVAGGGLPCGQVIGSTDRRGYDIAETPVRPADLAATVFHHLDIDLASQWVNPQGRPIPIVTEGGRLIPGLC